MNITLENIHGRSSAAMFDAPNLRKADSVNRKAFADSEVLVLLSEVMSHLRAVKMPFVQFISLSGNDGVSDVAGGFARACATHIGRTLLMRQDAITVADAATSVSVQSPGQVGSSADSLCIVPDSIVPALYHTALSGNLCEIAQLDQRWLDLAVEKRALDFRLVVIEAAAPQFCPATLELAVRCHATILLVHAGQTTHSHLNAVIRQIRRVGGTLLGTVLHDAPPRPRLVGLPGRRHAKPLN